MGVNFTDDGRQALRSHLARQASDARLRYGLYIDADAVFAMLEDRRVVRRPVSVRFDAGPLEPGEPANAQPAGQRAGDGFSLVIHPDLARRRELLPLVVAYYIPSMNYGEIVTHKEAELFGATLLGLDIDTYYQAMCEIADSLPSAAPRAGDGDP